MDVVSYILSKKYTNETAIQFGGLKGANCQVKSAVKTDGQTVVTLLWKNDDDETRETKLYINDGQDGTPIYTWSAGTSYQAGDLAIYDASFYLCAISNSDAVFDPNKWVAIGSTDGNYGIVDQASELPSIFTAADRKIYYAIQEGSFYLWNGTEWIVISTGGGGGEAIVRRGTIDVTVNTSFPLTVTFDTPMPDTNYLITFECIGSTPTQLIHRMIPYSKTVNGFTVQLDNFFIENTGSVKYVAYELTGGGGGGGGDASLQSDLDVTRTVGGINSGKHYDTGTELETILRNMLNPVDYPTLTNPSASISATGVKLLEKGATLNTTVTVSFNRGTINPAYGTSGYRSGAATGYSLNGGTEQAGNTFAITVSESVNKTLIGNVKYAAGEQPKDSVGNNYSTPLSAGNVNSNTITYEFVNALWANTTSAGTIEKQSLVSKSAKVKAFAFPATTATDPECFDVPADYNVTAVEVLNTLSNQWEDASGQFTTSNVNHDDAGGTSTAYIRYSCNLGISLGARQVRVKWS